MPILGLRRFLARYAALSVGPPATGSAPGLARFLDDARPLLGQEQARAPERAGPPSPDPRRLAAALAALRGPLQRARASGEFLQVWAVAGIGRNELRNAAVLAWLLDPRGSHGYETRILEEFLVEVRADAPSWPPLTGDLARARVRTEERPLWSDRDRVDIAVDGPDFVLFIEVKIGAAEGGSQLRRYSEAAREKADVLRKAHALVAYLSPRAPLDPPPGVAVVTWRHVARALSRIPADGLNGLLVRQYARHVRSFSKGN